MKAHIHSQRLPQIEESPQISQRTLDIVSLIEKKLTTIESSFQKVTLISQHLLSRLKFGDRILKLEAKEGRISSSSPMKFDDPQAHRYTNKPNSNEFLEYKVIVLYYIFL